MCLKSKLVVILKVFMKYLVSLFCCYLIWNINRRGVI